MSITRYLCAVLKRNYDSIAWFYDGLSRLVFGNALIKAKLFLLDSIPSNSRLLIVGGGTGWVLEEIAKKHPSGLHINSIDASAKMVALARKRNAGANQVTFITSTIEDATLVATFDVVLTPFLFDNFTEKGMRKIISLLDQQLVKGGIWLYCDFRNTGSLLQRTMLKIMYLFFRLSCGIEATGLPPTEACFEDREYKILKQETFLNGFVVSSVYEKPVVH